MVSANNLALLSTTVHRAIVSFQIRSYNSEIGRYEEYIISISSTQTRIPHFI